ncbi:MAG: hypothetical protein ACXWUL_01215 [Caldimonas sp.]
MAAWLAAFETMVSDATARVEHDADIDAAEQRRLRFGVYFYSEPQADARARPAPAAPAAPRAPKPIKRRSS